MSFPVSCVVDMADAMDVKAGLEALIQAAQFLEENGGIIFIMIL